METLGQVIIRARARKNITIRELAEELYMLPERLRDVESGRGILSVYQTRRASKLLGLNLDELMVLSGRVRKVVTDYLRRTPRAAEIVGKIADANLDQVRLEKLALFVDQLITTEDSPM